MDNNFFHKYFCGDGLQYLNAAISLALAEDGQDLTSEAVFCSCKKNRKAFIVAKENTLVVGLPIINHILKANEGGGSVELCVNEGSLVDKGCVVANIIGRAEILLKVERVILNFISHLSGVANLTQKYVQELEGTNVSLLDTRKTLPCLRWPEKYAVLMGGGKNHRRNLSEMLMLKDNHIDALGSINAAVKCLRTTYKDKCPPIEVECRTLEDVIESIDNNVSRIMLDNMSTDMLAQALDIIPPHMETEISGNVSIENIRELALIGTKHVQYISVGKLTHSVTAADFSMYIDKE